MKISTVETMTLDGGVACLDLVNSGYDREKDVVFERLHSYNDLLLLTGRLNLLSEEMLKDLSAAAVADPNKAAHSLEKAREARELFYKLFSGIASRPINEVDALVLAEANQLFIQALNYKVLVNDNGLRFAYQPKEAGSMAPVWSFVLSAYDLLDKGELQYLKQCERCAWLFVDKTKSHRKKWCSMESCGNGQKTKRYYLKKKTGGIQTKE